MDTSGTAYYTREIETEVYLDERFEIGKPYPNPSTNQATVEVTVREKQPVEVGLYDVLGRRVRTVRTGELAGQRTRQLQVETGRLASGLYFLRVDGKDFMEVRRIMVVH